MGRETRRRTAIRTALESAGRPLSPQEILKKAQRSVPSLGIATVYRSVNLLVEQGWAKVVALPNGPARYEPSDKGHHHHFVCTVCERVWDVGCPGGVIPLTPSGFELEAHELLLYGRCRPCAE